MPKFGERVKKVRKSLGLTQKEFSKELGVSHAHISKIEHGFENASTTLKKLLCLVFNISYEWLETGKGKMKV